MGAMDNTLWEGGILHAEHNIRLMANMTGLRAAHYAGEPLEARAEVFDREHNLIVPLCRDVVGVMPYDECAMGLSDGSTREISVLSRVGKAVRFVIEGFYTLPDGRVAARLSRRAVQQRVHDEVLSRLRPGDILSFRVTHVRQFGCFVDVGAGIPALLPVDALSVSRIPHPCERVSVGDTLVCAVRSVDAQGRLLLTMKELLGTWEENAALFCPGETVMGTVRSVLDYGVFVELTPNLSGLAEPHEGAAPGRAASVYIKSISPERMKVKLSVIDCFEDTRPRAPFRYFITEGHIDRFIYSPPGCDKTVETVFAQTVEPSGVV